jgi:acyl-CoA synthetase (AMP-forming)/AMP-acid ligase II/acyl carrier protein
MMSGDWIPLTLPDQLRSVFPGAQLMSLGGATEASIWSIWYRIEDTLPEWRSIPYGVPMRNQAMQVLDAQLSPVPVWAVGDLYIGGIGLAREYWRDGDRTARSFVISPRTGERLYRTGDLARYRPGGLIEFLGRDDDQVKVQGYRIELGEIEAAMLHHSGVRAAVAIADGAPGGPRRLIAYFVADPDVNEPDLRGALQTRLPAYMVPSALVRLDSMPLSSNGKVDRRALPAVEEVRGTREYVAPRTPTEEAIAAIWKDVLGAQLGRPISVDETFFDVGGDSVTAARVLTRIRDGFGVSISIRSIFDRPTIEGVAAAVDSAKLAGAASDDDGPIVPLKRRGR